MKFYFSLLWLGSTLFITSCTIDQQKTKRQFPSALSYGVIEGVSDSVWHGKISVWENPDLQSGRKIDLYMIIIPAIRQDSVLAPIFFVNGGPGVSASGNASFYSKRTTPYRYYHDIVLLDSRGTGKSNPLHCRSLQYFKDVQDQFREMYPAAAVQQCYDSLSQFADLTQYTTDRIVHDLNEVRQWLGYEKINLMGVSYGTRVVQHFMRKHPEQVAKSVLWSTTSMDIRMPMYHAPFAQQSLDKIFQNCANDSSCRVNFPELKNEFNDLMRRGRTTPFQTKHKFSNGEIKTITITWDAFQTKIRSLSYSSRGIAQIPFLIHSAYQNNWKPFISLYAEGADYDDSLAEGLYLCITCAEDVPFIDQVEAARAASGTFMEMYRVDQQTRACSIWKQQKASSEFIEPVKSEISTLIVSGYFDPVTPPEMADAVLANYPNGQLIRLPKMSHSFYGLTNEGCFDRMVTEFFRQDTMGSIDISCIDEMESPPYKIK